MKRAIILLASLVTSAAVALSGIIGFVGLIIPHISRMLVGPDHRILLPSSALIGAVFLVCFDAISRVIYAPAEFPVGVMTALIGGPFFLYLLRAKKGEYAI
jgi:iron complex transport system permease protein